MVDLTGFGNLLRNWVNPYDFYDLLILSNVKRGMKKYEITEILRSETLNPKNPNPKRRTSPNSPYAPRPKVLIVKTSPGRAPSKNTNS